MRKPFNGKDLLTIISQDKRLYEINKNTYDWEGKKYMVGDHILLMDNKKPISPYNAGKALSCIKGPVKALITGQLHDVSRSGDVLLHALEESQKYKDELLAVSQLSKNMAAKLVKRYTGEKVERSEA